MYPAHHRNTAQDLAAPRAGGFSPFLWTVNQFPHFALRKGQHRKKNHPCLCAQIKISLKLAPLPKLLAYYFLCLSLQFLKKMGNIRKEWLHLPVSHSLLSQTTKVIPPWPPRQEGQNGCCELDFRQSLMRTITYLWSLQQHQEQSTTWGSPVYRMIDEATCKDQCLKFYKEVGGGMSGPAL